MLSRNLDLECHKTQPNTSADGRKPLVGLPKCMLPLASAVMPQVLGGGATAKLSVGVQHQASVRLLVGQINSQNRVGL
jgi:hypothetical protein